MLQQDHCHILVIYILIMILVPSYSLRVLNRLKQSSSSSRTLTILCTKRQQHDVFCVEPSDAWISFQDGQIGRILSRNRGWLTIQIRNSKQIRKARPSEVQPVLLEPVVMAETATTCTTSSSLCKVIEPPRLHQQTLHWLVFSDLHVKASSLETCEAILDHLHKEAVARQAGIIFLGDFWHVRGVLNVELLNRILQCLRKWTQPVIMIPGNHDQVTLGGMVHALEPLFYAFPKEQALLINEPSICLNALWIPYRRDHLLMKTILEEAKQRSDQISMIFCHADVRGAYMNDGMRSREGINVDLFPNGIPIFSGHFHKPHTVSKSGINLRYVGSPYQTSLSEADQEKYLYQLSLEKQKQTTDSEEKKLKIWKESHRWPITFGRRYFKLEGCEDPKMSSVKPGDRVVLMVNNQEADQADSLAQKMRSDGVEVELRVEQMTLNKPTATTQLDSPNVNQQLGINEEGVAGKGNQSLPSSSSSSSESWMTTSDHNNAHRLLEIYINSLTMETLNQQSKAKTNSEANEEYLIKRKQALLKEGQSLLQTLIESSPSFYRSKANDDMKNLELEQVTLSNFGPYGGEPVHYPLDKRGLVLIQGRVEDETGADSNGSGKTTLAMSVMWCLTGSMDARLIADSRSADVAFDSYMTDEASKLKRIAEVSLRGRINQQSFEIIRRKGIRKSELFFYLDGKDMTTLSVKDTQSLIEETLGIGNGLLQRCCFYGQHTHTQQSLLGLQDVRLKDELSKLVDVSLWIEATKESKQREKLVQEKLQELNFTMKMKQNELLQVQQSKQQAQLSVEKVEEDKKKLENQYHIMNNKLEEIVQLYNETEKACQILEESKRQYQKDILPLRQELLSYLDHQQGGSSGSSSGSGGLVAGGQYVDSVSRGKGRQTPPPPLLPEKEEEEEERIYHLKVQLVEEKAKHTNCLLEWKQQEMKLKMIDKEMKELDSLIAEDIEEWRLQEDGLGSYKKEEISNRLLQWKEESEAGTIELGGYNMQIEKSNATYQYLLSINRTSSSSTTTTPCSNSHHHHDRNGSSSGGGSGSKGNTMVVVSHENDTSYQDQHQHHHAAAAMSDDTCPTCGQGMPSTNRQERFLVIQLELEGLLRARQKVLSKVMYCKLGIQLAERLLQRLGQLEELQLQLNSLQLESQRLYPMLQESKEIMRRLEDEIKKKEREELQLLQEVNAKKMSLQQALTQIENQLLQIDQQLANEQEKLEKLRKSKNQSSKQLSDLNYSLGLLQNKANYTKKAYQEKVNHYIEIEQFLTKMIDDKNLYYEEISILNQLTNLFGSRGIQNYLFSFTLQDLENVSNRYLQILAQGGMQLSLRSDEDGERILKTVLMRQLLPTQPQQETTTMSTMSTMSTVYKERALSLLSGGQWRRVSLALDLAFTDMIRKKGFLRCNLLVMDEVLSHLDGQGREAVGSVLRALVAPSGGSGSGSGGNAKTIIAKEEKMVDDDDDVEVIDTQTEGSNNNEKKQKTIYSNRNDMERLEVIDQYATILVILQDVVAGELEEAFDHIDIVVKRGETSRVVLDD